jgi:hypothetical protein
MDLRHGLGTYHPENGIPFPGGHLTLHELAELIRRAGCEDFIVQSERKVCWDTGRGKLDWVWLHRETKKPAVAFEIEGRDAHRGSLYADFEKFDCYGAPINVIALFQVDHDHSPKRELTDGWVKRCLRDWAAQRPGSAGRFTDSNLKIYFDTDLMAEGGIEGLQSLAKRLPK